MRAEQLRRPIRCADGMENVGGRGGAGVRWGSAGKGQSAGGNTHEVGGGWWRKTGRPVRSGQQGTFVSADHLF